MRRLPLLVLLLALACPLAGAHAEPRQQDPSPGAVLGAPPSEMRLVLTQPAEAAGLTFRLERIGTGDVAGQVERAPDGLTLRFLPATPLSNGTYVQHWAVVSAADGHPTSGAWSFTVGQPSGAAPASTSASRILWGAAIAQGAAFAGMALVVGAAAWRWTMPGRILHSRGAALGGTLVAAGSGALLAQSASALGGMGAALATWHGAAVAMLCLLGAATTAFLRKRSGLLTTGAAGLVLLAPAVGHAGHALPFASWLVGALHAAATAAWAGGLAFLAWARTRGPGISLGDFTRLASPALALTVLTGAALAGGLAGPNPIDWAASPYGRLLLAKLLAVAAMAALGAWHRRHRGRPAASAKRSLAAEASLGVVALLLTGVLAAASPGTPATPSPGPAAQTEGPLLLEESAGAYKLTLHVTPRPSPGVASAWVLRIVDQQANQGVGNAIVDLQLHGPSAEAMPVPLKQQGFAWTAHGSFIPTAGHWNAKLRFSTPQAAELEAVFTVHVT